MVFRSSFPRWATVTFLLGLHHRYTEAFLRLSGNGQDLPHLFASPSDAISGQSKKFDARVLGAYPGDSDFSRISDALLRRGFRVIDVLSDNKHHECNEMFLYKYQKATGLLQLVSLPSNVDPEKVPKWIPLVNDMESVLIRNGWSFLDPDESEPVSAFDVDASNLEGTYKPRWGENDGVVGSGDNAQLQITSSIGFNIAAMLFQEVDQQASALPHHQSRLSLLEGATDLSGAKTTANGIPFSGAAGQSELPRGIFTCAIGGLPLFSTLDLAPTTASSGWLSFTRAIAEDHIVLVQPDPDSQDQRIEVLCARSRCHLGHYFGSDGFCINASGLNFLKTSTNKPQDKEGSSTPSLFAQPLSWRCLDVIDTPSQQLLKDFLVENIPTQKIVFGAGCFWHVEAALRRLIGVVDTKVGFSGGTAQDPSYEDVCRGNTGHAEVVMVEYSPDALSKRMLVDAFFALHDPTKVRSHGKHAAGTGQYRSMIFALDNETVAVARDALSDCGSQLEKEIITEIKLLGEGDFASWFILAEERHQRHEENRCNAQGKTETLAPNEWLQIYGKRRDSILGSSSTMDSNIST